jgi:hypothetical protein
LVRDRDQRTEGGRPAALVFPADGAAKKRLRPVVH